MPVLDGDFEAFVTNLGKYNEGMLVGEWVKLPTTEEEMQKVFERIGIGKQDEFGQPYEEWFITDYECPIYGVQKMLGEYESLDKLNYLAALIDELSLSDQEKLVAIMEAGCDEVSDIDDLINLTFNLDCYDIMPGINDESDLGYYYAHHISDIEICRHCDCLVGIHVTPSVLAHPTDHFAACNSCRILHWACASYAHQLRWAFNTRPCQWLFMKNIHAECYNRCNFKRRSTCLTLSLTCMAVANIEQSARLANGQI